ncbi:innexin inx2-like isoform X2 [Panonychus citri]|nr:innexin inx2-like isoform X2 [Panonychus citri]
MVGTMFVSMRQYFGEPIDCLTKDSDIKASLIEHYCWIEGAFSVLGGGETGTSSAYPGVAPTTSASIKRHHKYYQWVYFVLIIQAVMFYLPKFLWRSTESGRLKDLISKLSGKSVAELDENSRIALVQEVADNLGISHNYLITVILCEVYCLVHLAVQIWFTNIFLGGSFYTLGLRWLSYANHYSSDDPLISIFPRMVKCTFHKYGFSGTMETKDALCFLPLNIVNEKIYAILWIWFAILLAITTLHLTVETFFISFRSMRILRVSWLAPGCNQSFVRGICKRAGHWLILSFVANNIKPSYFRDLMAYLERDHFDRKGRPLHISRVGEALAVKITGSKVPSAGQSTSKSMGSKKSFKKQLPSSNLTSALTSNLMGSNKHHNLSTYLRTSNCDPPGPGFVIGTASNDWRRSYEWDEDNGTNEVTKLTSGVNYDHCDGVMANDWEQMGRSHVTTIGGRPDDEDYSEGEGRTGEGCSGEGNIDWHNEWPDESPTDDEQTYDNRRSANQVNLDLNKKVIWPSQ